MSEWKNNQLKVKAGNNTGATSCLLACVVFGESAIYSQVRKVTDRFCKRPQLVFPPSCARVKPCALSHTVPRAAEWHWATHQSYSLRQFHPGRWICVTGSRSKRNTNETKLSSRSSGSHIFRRVVCWASCRIPTIQALRRWRQQNWWGVGVQSQPHYLTRLRPAWATWSPPQTKWNVT